MSELKWKVLSAKGDWQQYTPQGMVSVHLGLGGRQQNGMYPSKQIIILVPKKEYSAVQLGHFERSSQELKNYKKLSMVKYNK